MEKVYLSVELHHTVDKQNIHTMVQNENPSCSSFFIFLFAGNLGLCILNHFERPLPMFTTISVSCSKPYRVSFIKYELFAQLECG